MPSLFIDRVCKNCGKVFKARKSDVKRGRGNYCSRECARLARRRVNEIKVEGNIAFIIITDRKGKEVARAMIDAADVEKIKQFGHRWCLGNSKGKAPFVETRANGKIVLLHRFLLDAPEGIQVDHINHNTLDNRRCNLRLCTPAQNSQNRKGAYRTSKSGIRGVSWYAPGRKWRATITVNYRQISLGYYDSLEEAAKAAEIGRQKYMTHSLN